MNPPDMTRLADTASAERLDTAAVEGMTQGTVASIREAIRALKVGDHQTEKRVVEVVGVKFHGHLVSVARSVASRYSPSLEGRLPSPSELVQAIFSESAARTKIIRNLANLRKSCGDEFRMRDLLRWLTVSARWGFKTEMAKAFKRAGPDSLGEEDWLGAAEDGDLDPTRGAAAEIEEQEAWKRIELLIDGNFLKEVERDVIVLRYGAGMCLREIARLSQDGTLESKESSCPTTERQVRETLDRARKFLLEKAGPE